MYFSEICFFSTGNFENTLYKIRHSLQNKRTCMKIFVFFFWEIRNWENWNIDNKSPFWLMNFRKFSRNFLRLLYLRRWLIFMITLNFSAVKFRLCHYSKYDSWVPSDSLWVKLVESISFNCSVIKVSCKVVGASHRARDPHVISRQNLVILPVSNHDLIAGNKKFCKHTCLYW